MVLLAAKPSRRTAPFHLAWVLQLHREIIGRATQGVTLVKLKQGDRLIAAARVVGPRTTVVLEVGTTLEIGRRECGHG